MPWSQSSHKRYFMIFQENPKTLSIEGGGDHSFTQISYLTSFVCAFLATTRQEQSLFAM